jgi:diaminopimelate epimerase
LSIKRLKEITFTKMEGTGNDFIVFDNRYKTFTGKQVDFFNQICQRRLSVGADGVILIEKGQSHPIRMRYFNRDGYEAEMCGNGARCVAYYVKEKGILNQNAFTLEASDGVHPVQVEGHLVTIQLIQPTGYRTNFGIVKESEFKEGGLINTGVPHYVLFVEDLKQVDVKKIGAYYAHHEAFPEGVNVNFVQAIGRDRIRFRIFERGVEDETYSSGTGCVASALIASRLFNYHSPIEAQTRGGDLRVTFDAEWKSVFIEGPVSITFEGTLPTRIFKKK